MKTVFFDIDTQIDFLFPAGALYAPGAEAVVGPISRLNRYAVRAGIPVVSTTDAHFEDDPEFRQWPPHCVAGTAGQQKACATLLEKRVVIPGHRTAFSLDAAQQIVIEKQKIDCFSNQNLAEVLERLGAGRYVVYGVVTEYCVRSAAFGLLETGKRVEVVTDAIRSLDETEGRRVLESFVSRGGHLTTAAEVAPPESPVQS